MNLKDLRKRWDNLSKAQKSIIIVMMLSVILASAFFVQWLSKVEYAELFKGLDPQGAGQVVEKLKELDVPYKLSSQGSTILVPAEQVYDLRLQLATSGTFAVGGSGFELFDESRIGITDYERQLNYQRALQEELRRTIIQLDVVEQARVHLSLPEQSLFIREQGQASASITLKLNPMADIQPSQVLAIVNLVAGSIEKLEPNNVHVIDTGGRILTEGLFDDAPGFLVSQNKQYEQKRRFEKDLEQRVQALVQQILGIGKTVAMVTAELDYDHREVTKIEFGESHIRSEQTLDEEHVNRPAGGIVTEENLQDLGTTYPELEEGESTSNVTERVSNYELDQTQETVVYAPGKLISLSTAVAVDGELNDDTIDAIHQIVGAAIGFNPERGDQIAVMSMGFDKAALQEAEMQMALKEIQEQKEQQIKTYVSWGFRALGLIFAFILLVLVIRTIGGALKSSPIVQEPVPISQMEEVIVPKPVVKDEAAIKQEQVKKVADENPDDTAALLRTWMMEDQ